jgi:hypothetical protein
VIADREPRGVIEIPASTIQEVEMTQRGQSRAVPASSGGGALCFLRTTQAAFVDNAEQNLSTTPQSRRAVRRLTPDQTEKGEPMIERLGTLISKVTSACRMTLWRGKDDPLILASPMSNTLTVKTDVGDIEVRESELASITDEKLKRMGMSLADLRYGFTAVKWFTNIGRRAVAYRRPDGGLMVQAVKLD